MDIEYFGPIASPSAVVIRSTAKVEGIQFFSPSEYSQQLGLMTRPAGYIVPAHIHNQVERTIFQTQEVLLVRTGNCKIVLFGDDLKPKHEVVLSQGDVIFLATGGHSIEMLSECELLEVKQGPYAGIEDKTHIGPL